MFSDTVFWTMHSPWMIVCECTYILWLLKNCFLINRQIVDSPRKILGILLVLLLLFYWYGKQAFVYFSHFFLFWLAWSWDAGVKYSHWLAQCDLDRHYLLLLICKTSQLVWPSGLSVNGSWNDWWVFAWGCFRFWPLINSVMSFLVLLERLPFLKVQD